MLLKPADGLGTQLRRLLELLDGEVEQVYREDHPFYVPRYTPVMKALADGDPLTIKAIASRSSVSHSAASQTVAKLKSHGLVTVTNDADRRSRAVSLTQEGRALLPWLQRRWAATEDAANGLDEGLDFPLSRLLAQTIEHLEAEGFAERIRRHMDAEDTVT